MFQCHKTYLHDFSRRGDLRRVRELTDGEAQTLLAASQFVKREPDDDEDGSLLLNKGFCVVMATVGGRCHIVYNHDGRYALWDGDWAFFAEDLGLGP